MDDSGAAISAEASVVPKKHPLLKYYYQEDQWSPLNKSGQKVYDRDFLIKLRDDPKSKTKPLNLPDVEGVLKDNSTNNRGSLVFGQLEDSNIGGHNFVSFGGYVKPPQRVPKPNRKQNNLKSKISSITNVCDTDTKQNIQDVSESTPSEPDDTKKKCIAEVALFKTVQQVLKYLTPETFNSSVQQIKTLRIDSEEKLKILVNLVFAQAVDMCGQFIGHCSMYAKLCGELCMMRVSISENESETGREYGNDNFRKFIIIRCVMEFENAVEKNAEVIQKKEIEAIRKMGNKQCYTLSMEEKQERRKLFAIIRFIGELFKLELLTTFIVHRCIRHLLTQIDLESMCCLFELLTSTGELLESKNEDLDQYFAQLCSFADSNKDSEIGVAVRIHLEGISNLRSNSWRRSGNDIGMERNNEIKMKMEKKHKGKPLGETAHCFMVRNEPVDSRDDLIMEDKIKFKNISPEAVLRGTAIAETITGGQHKESDFPDSMSTSAGPKDDGSQHQRSSVSLASESTINGAQEHLATRYLQILEDYLSDQNIETASIKVYEDIDDDELSIFLREVLSKVIKMSSNARELVGQLVTRLISEKILPLSIYTSVLTELFDSFNDSQSDDSDTWIQVAELIWYPLANGMHPFNRLEETISSFRGKNLAGKMMGELLKILFREKGRRWVQYGWDSCGIDWTDLLEDDASLIDYVEKYELQFLFKDRGKSLANRKEQLSMKEIHMRLLDLMSRENEKLSERICCWISANVGERSEEPEFVGVLMTAILKVSIEPCDDTWRFKEDKFQHFQNLILRYIDDNINLSELECLIANQKYLHQTEHPQRLLLLILEKQIYESILSIDVFHVLERSADLTPQTKRSAAMSAIKSYFASLEEQNRRRIDL